MAEKIDADLLAEFAPDAQATELRQPARLARLVLPLLLALIATAVLWASLSHIDTVIVGRGKLVTPLPNLVLQPLETSVLKSIDVRLGQIVRRGETLATLDPTFVAADTAQLGARSRTLSAQVERLAAELDGGEAQPLSNLSQQPHQNRLLGERRANYAARLKQFDETIARLQSTLRTNRVDQSTQAQRLQTLKDLESMHQELSGKQFGSRANLLETREKRLEIERDYEIARHKDAEILNEIKASEAEKESFVKSWRQDALEEMVGAERDRDEAKEQLAKAERRKEMIHLVAPEDAVVLEIAPRSVGSVVKDAEPLLTLVPLDPRLEVEAELSPSDVGEVRVGDRVRIKIDAYPFQKHGTATGHLATLSRDAFSRSSDPATKSGSVRSVYLARIALDDTRLRKLPENFPLIPGMTVQAEIVTGRRRVITYFLYPIIRTLDEALRER